jgi:signal peptidase II
VSAAVSRASGTTLAKAGLTMLLALAADQLSKAIVRGSIEPTETVSFLPGIDLVRVANDGVAFGLFDNLSSGVLVVIGIAFTLGLAAFLVREAEARPAIWLPIGLLAGGAVGNLLDRLREGYVTDFIDPPAWPAFNLADIEITFGVILLAWMLLREPEQ